MAQDVKVRFGKNARIEVAPYTDGSEPPAAAWQHLCLTNRVSLGGEKGTETFENFCTEGNEVEVLDGSEKGTLEFGDTTWTEDDAALAVLKKASKAKTEDGSKVHYRVFPLGKGEGKPVFRGIFQVKNWKLDVPSKGLIKIENGVTPLGVPEEGTQGADGAFTPLP
ncbi:hypothetical protein Dcar01_02390 [Deinococcus carri]|uniref:Uncharacterized protein n=1 Tax=Deinococcus carri TaxID=1211323 RepID=A0ABP9W8H5_9DEIO